MAGRPLVTIATIDEQLPSILAFLPSQGAGSAVRVSRAWRSAVRTTITEAKASAAVAAAVAAAAAVPLLTPVYEPGKIRAGSTLERATSGSGINSWAPCDPRAFNVRVGPDYPRNKKKASSVESIFELACIDVFSCSSKQNHIVRSITLPPAPPPATTTAAPSTTSESKGVAPSIAADIPHFFVLNFQLPSYEPPNPIWGAVKEDGVGYSLVFYFALTAATRAALASPTPSNAVKLVKNFFTSRDDGYDDDKKRLKAIPFLINPAELSLALPVRKLVQSYNAKPFMTGPRCHTFFRGSNYVEVDVDVHKFCFMARKGANGLMTGSLDKMVVDVAVVIEGTDDGELPEQILGCGRLSRLDVNKAMTLEHWLKVQAAAQAAPAKK